MSEALAACPFCGLPGYLEAQFAREWWVQCPSGHSTGIVHNSAAEAEEEWNRRAPTSAAGATKPNELTSSPEPAPASPTMSKSMLKRMAHAPAPSPASGLLPVAREGLTQAQINEVSRTLFYNDDDADWGPDTLNAIWVRDIATPLARAIEAAHGIAPASGDAPGEAK